jgi:hypothetical protein
MHLSSSLQQPLAQAWYQPPGYVANHFLVCTTNFLTVVACNVSIEACVETVETQRPGTAKLPCRSFVAHLADISRHRGDMPTETVQSIMRLHTQ